MYTKCTSGDHWLSGGRKKTGQPFTRTVPSGWLLSYAGTTAGFFFFLAPLSVFLNRFFLLRVASSLYS